MSEIGENLKNILKKGFEAIGSKASDLAANAKQKVGEYNLTNQKNDLFCAIGRKIYELALDGETPVGFLHAERGGFQRNAHCAGIVVGIRAAWRRPTPGGTRRFCASTFRLRWSGCASFRGKSALPLSAVCRKERSRSSA